MKVEIYKGQDGDWWWRVRASNSQIVAVSGEGYKRLIDCKRMARKVTRRFLNVVVTED